MFIMAQNTDIPIGIDLTANRRRPRWQNWLVSLLCALFAGLLASLATVVIMGILRLWFGIPTPVELFGDYVLKHINVSTFIHLLTSYGANAKTAPLGQALLAMIGIGTLLACLYALIVRINWPIERRRPSRLEWIVTLALGLIMTLIGTVLFWDELRQNFYGLPFDLARFTSIIGLLLDFMLYTIVLCLAYRFLLPRKAYVGEEPQQQSRRQLFARAGVAALTVGSAGGVVGLVKGYLAHYTSYDGMQSPPHNHVTAPITPNNEHYVVTQNPVDPAVNTDLWRLELTGMVNRSGSYNYNELQQLPSTSRAITLECIANAVGHSLISTAIWHGILLKSLLERHGGASPDAKYIAFHSVDGYTISLPLNEVLEADPLLAWQMNGSVLPQRHGYPLRVLIPGRYGEENPKWLTRIELTDHFVGGLYSNQGWYNGPLHTTSRIDHPRDTVQTGRTIEVGGLAFAGNRGIQKVEVSVDDGATWTEAELQPPLSQDAWVFWKWLWTPAKTGTYTLVCRATDGTGALQNSNTQGTVPNGATGYHRVEVQAQ